MNGSYGINVNTQQSSTNSAPNEGGSGKANRKGASSAEISDSSVIVLKQGSNG